MLQHLMGLVIKLFVEALKIPEIVRVKLLSVMTSNHFGDAFTLAAHRFKVKSRAQSLKPKVVWS